MSTVPHPQPGHHQGVQPGGQKLSALGCLGGEGRLGCRFCGEPTRHYVCPSCHDLGLDAEPEEPTITQARAEKYAHSLEIHPLRVVPMPDGALLEVHEAELDRWLAHRAWDVRVVTTTGGRCVVVDVHGAPIRVYARASVARQEAA